MTSPLAQAVLTPEDQAFFEQQGYLLVEDALPADALAELNAATDANSTRAMPTPADWKKAASSTCATASSSTPPFSSFSTGPPRFRWRGNSSAGISRC